MNQNKQVVWFTLTTVCLLLLLSAFTEWSKAAYLSLNNVSIISDLVKRPVAQQAAKDTAMTATAQTANVPKAAVLAQYELPGSIFRFGGDTTKPSLPLFVQRLIALKAKHKGKIRIAWLGDSIIEGDLVTQTFRRKIQAEFGGQGVGFVPMQSATASFRNTVGHHWTGNWKEENFKSDTHTVPLFFSGHVYFPVDGSVSYNDRTVKDSNQVLVKSLICGPAQGPVSVTVNGEVKTFETNAPINRLMLDSSRLHTITAALSNSNWPVYGISMEPENGVVVDNFSFRGISGVELNRLDSNVLANLGQRDAYDLIILEYGANLMYTPNNKDYSWFKKKMNPVLAHLRKSLPGTEILLISTSDRAFKYDDGWATAIGMDNLLQMQAQLAKENDMGFYNMFASMGGPGTIVRWADSSNALANKDYIHPNNKGAEILGNLVFDAVMKDYHKGF